MKQAVASTSRPRLYNGLIVSRKLLNLFEFMCSRKWLRESQNRLLVIDPLFVTRPRKIILLLLR